MKNVNKDSSSRQETEFNMASVGARIYKSEAGCSTDCYTIMCTNNEKNDQFYRKVTFLMYPERVNFRPQSWKEASKLKPHRGLGTRLPST